MPYAYTLTSVFPATPEEIYEAWLDSLSHTEMTGGEASMSDEVGAEVSAWDGYISGRNLELVPGARIVQSWRTSQFGDEHEDSIVTISLAEADDGTLLTLVHSNVPDEQRSYEEGGWESNYFEPMRVYFAKLAQEQADEEQTKAEIFHGRCRATARTGQKIEDGEAGRETQEGRKGKEREESVAAQTGASQEKGEARGCSESQTQKRSAAGQEAQNRHAHGA